MRLFFLIGIIGLSGSIGLIISNHYKERKKFFFDFKNFICALKNEINFSLIKIIDAMEKFLSITKNKNLTNLISNYIYILKNKKELSIDGLFKDVAILTDQEKQNIFLFFNRLGRVDITNQISELDNYIKIFDENYMKVKFESEKYSSLYTKMGLLIGLFVAIIFA